MASQTSSFNGMSTVHPLGLVLGQTMETCQRHHLTNFICKEVNGKYIKVCEKCESECESERQLREDA